MKNIALFEEAIAKQAGSLTDYGINPTLFWAYREAKETGNDRINFSEVVWDKDIEAIVNCLNENTICEFTISSTFSSLIPTLATFEQHGFKVSGLTQVKARYVDFATGEREDIPAILIMRIR